MVNYIQFVITTICYLGLVSLYLCRVLRIQLNKSVVLISTILWYYL